MANVNSHIRMPKCVLRQFEDEKHFVYFLNLKEGWIQKTHAESINTEEGYYSKEVEHFLRDNIETPFGQILKFINSIDPKAPEFTMTNDKKVVMRRFVYALVSRSREMVAKIHQTSLFAQFMPERDQHDWAAVAGIREAAKRRLFEDWEITFMENHTTVPFVLPLCGTYSYKYNGDLFLNIPVTPHYTITFIPKAAAHKYIQGNTMRLFKIAEPDQVMRLNMFTLTSEKKDGNYGIASNSRDILEKIKQNL